MSKKKKKQMEKKRMALEKRKERVQELKSRPNPFEVRINKVKHQVVGRRLGKNEVGKPLQARSRGIEKRSKTLLKEMKIAHKSGRGLIDRRIKDSAGGSEARKARIYEAPKIDDKNVGEELLTHRGKDATTERGEIINSDVEDDDLDLMTRAEFIDSAHFGGGEDGKPARTREEFLQEIMKEKRARMREREEARDLTDALDKQFDEVRALLNLPKDNKAAQEKKIDDTYDLLLRNLSKDSRAKLESSDEPSKVPEDSKAEPVLKSKTQPSKDTAKGNEPTLLKQKPKQDEPKNKKQDQVSGYDRLIRQLQVIASYPDVGTPGISSLSKAPSKNPDDLFKEKFGELVKETKPSVVTSLIKELRQDFMPKTTPQTVVLLKNLLKSMKFKKLTLRTFAVVLVASEGKQFHPFLSEVLINMLRQQRHLNSLIEMVQRLLLGRLILRITQPAFVPELVNLTKNLCCLLSCDKALMERHFKPSKLLSKVNEDALMDSLNTAALDVPIPCDINLMELAFSPGSFEIEPPMLRLVVLRATLRLLKELLDKYKRYPSSKEIFADHRQIVNHFSSDPKSHPQLVPLIRELQPMFDQYSPPPPLPPPFEKPFMLPLIEPDFGDWRKLRPSKEKTLERKVKKEFRGAVRELRKDSHFIRKQWLDKTLQQDEIRKRKTQEIINDLKNQNCMFKKKRK